MVKITQKKIRSLKAYDFLLNGKDIIVAVDLTDHTAKAKQVGFSSFDNGVSVLPSVIGNVTTFNAYGTAIIRKDLPKEICYRQSLWCWEQWCGRGQTQRRCKIVDIPYKRYPRTPVAPPSLQLKIANQKIVTEEFHYPKDSERLIHAVNLYLEVFGECYLLNDKLEEFSKIPVKTLNWSILPKGKNPWEIIAEHLDTLFKKNEKNKRFLFEDRLKLIKSHEPDFIAVGNAGFSGYLIFGFEKKKLYICESIWYGNAIYVFNEDWETLSQKTKAEILQANLQTERITHYANWRKKLTELLGKP